MAKLPIETTHEIRDRCLCLHAQRAARALARRFDNALLPFELTNGQFSLLAALNRPAPPTVNDVAALLGMDRTTLTASLKALARRGLVAIAIDAKDRRVHRLVLRAKGAALVAAAVPTWRKTHAALESSLSDPDSLRAALRALER